MAWAAPASHVLTFLFTDIEGSTWLVQHLGDDWDRVLHEHYRLLRDAWEQHGGREVSTEGDAFFVVFTQARDAIGAARHGQELLAAHPWPDGAPVRVRIGLHTGKARVYDGDYVGLAVHQAARVSSAAHGGQVIASQATLEAAGDDVDARDLGLHRLKDLAEPVRLFDVRYPGAPDDLPPPRTLTVMPNNFPVQATTFVGRDDDIASVRALLGSSRVVTLTGAGGIGKTRLALHVGAEVLDDAPDGAWLVDLAPLSDGATVPAAIASALHIREQPGRPVADTVVDALVAKDLLIVLDNCEHVIDASAGVVQRICSAAPAVKVLATSREALNVPGEASYRLRSLVVPEELGSGLAETARAEAVRLFVQRARSVTPDFDVTEDNAASIVHVCRRLDGLPLAIELAAARTRSLTVHEIAKRLDDRFRLLTGGARVALPRQRTLEATVAWSYDLLSLSDQLLFERLSVFAGGCTLDAAETVCAGGEVDAVDVLDGLARLVDRSLVTVEEDDGRSRYGLLETLRQFGRERQLARGEGALLRDRHLAWAASLAPSLPPQTGPLPPDEVRTEEDNIRTAIEWSLETGNHVPALTILAHVWSVARYAEREGWYERLLRSVGQLDAPIAAKVLSGGAGDAILTGDWTKAAERYAAGIRAAREAADDHLVAMDTLYLGSCLWALEDEDAARALVEEGLAVAHASSDGAMIRRGNMFLAWIETARDPARALEVSREFDADARHDGSPFDQAHAREVYAFALAQSGDLARASEVLASAVPLFADVLLGCSSHLLETAAALAAMTGRFELGAVLWGAGDRLRELTGDRARPWEREVQQHWLPMIEQRLDADAFAAARVAGAAMPLDDAMAYAEREMRSLTVRQ
jgi:predicted ATPase/class 3 adenylate cyclase